MKIYKDAGTISGFRYESPLGKSPFLTHAGEYWSSPGHFVPDHAHRVWEFLYQMRGGTAWKEGNRRHTVNADELLICPPRLPHGMAERAGGEFRICFFGSCLGDGRKPALESLLRKDRLTVLRGAHSLRPHLQRLLDEISTEQPFRAEALRLILGQTLICIRRLLSAAPPAAPGHHGRLSVRRIKTLIAESPGEPWTLPVMARMAGYSPGYFAGLFHRETGMAPHACVLEARILRARDFLGQGGRSVTEIAMELGFSSSQHLATAFRKLTGQSPRAFREIRGGKQTSPNAVHLTAKSLSTD